MLFYEISVLLGQPNFNRPGKIGSEYIRRVTSEKDIHVHPRFALKEMGQPIYDFAIIKANEPFWHMQKSVHNRMIPVCLPKRWMWHKQFLGSTAEISGYGRVEKIRNESKTSSMI